MGNRRVMGIVVILALAFAGFLSFWMVREGGIPWYGATNDGTPGTEGTPVSPRARGETPMDPDPTPQPADRVKKVEPERVALLRGTIREALTRALIETRTGTPAGSLGQEGDPPPTGPARLKPEYIQASVQDLEPLLAECYELARAEDPELSDGRLVVEFTVIGDEDLGAVIESAMITADSELRHPVLHECVRETMYSLELPPPDGLGELLVRYPFEFSP